MQVLDNWNIQDKAQCLLFDTTSCNTGIHRGACVVIDEAIGHKLVNIGCRHHVLEVFLSSVIIAVHSCFWTTDGPGVGHFKRFRKKWSYIDKWSTLQLYTKSLMRTTETLRKEMIIFNTKVIGLQQPLQDYLELLRLVFLGGSSLKTNFHAVPSSRSNAPCSMDVQSHLYSIVLSNWCYLKVRWKWLLKKSEVWRSWHSPFLSFMDVSGTRLHCLHMFPRMTQCCSGFIRNVQTVSSLMRPTLHLLDIYGSSQNTS